MTWGQSGGLKDPSGKGTLLCSFHPCWPSPALCLSPLLTSGVKHPVLVALNGSIFTCTCVIQTHNPSSFLGEIAEQVQSQLCRVITELLVSALTHGVPAGYLYKVYVAFLAFIVQ